MTFYRYGSPLPPDLAEQERKFASTPREDITVFYVRRFSPTHFWVRTNEMGGFHIIPEEELLDFLKTAAKPPPDQVIAKPRQQPLPLQDPHMDIDISDLLKDL